MTISNTDMIKLCIHVMGDGRDSTVHYAFLCTLKEMFRIYTKERTQQEISEDLLKQKIVEDLLQSGQVLTIGRDERTPDNKRIGEHINCYDNGQRSVHGWYDDEEQWTGMYTQWDKDGNITHHGEYKGGERVGDWTTPESIARKAAELIEGLEKLGVEVSTVEVSALE